MCSQLSFFQNQCKEINRSVQPYVGLVITYNGVDYRCTRVRKSGICTFVGIDKEGNLLPNLINDKGNVIDYRVRLIKFEKINQHIK